MSFKFVYGDIKFKATDMTGPVVVVLVLVLIMILAFTAAYLLKNNAWENLLRSGFMKGFFSEFDQDEIGKKLEFDIMRDFGYRNRGTVLDETVDVLSDDEDEDSDPEVVEKRVDDLEDGKESELIRI